MKNQNMNLNNIILLTDSYKMSQYTQYPEGTEEVFSYGESRGGKWDYQVFIGMQMLVDKFLLTPITQEDIDEAELFANLHGEPFNRAGWQHILHEYNGYIPVRIDAVPEGTVLRNRNVLFNVRNRGGVRTAFATSYIETLMLQNIWYPTTVATLSYSIKQIILEALEQSGTPESISFKLQDFGYRGVSSNESAGMGGLAHLVNFLGSDTIHGIRTAMFHYDADVCGFSIPASEHSTITSWGRDGEFDAYRNMITKFGKPGALVACVSDSYNIWKALEMWKELEDEIVASGCTLVIRPDSGDPVLTPVKVVQRLLELFGHTVNEKGYKVLPSYIRVIQGDGVNDKSIREICDMLMEDQISVDNIGFGMGGALLQQLDRDTLKFAMKCSMITINGVERDVFKDPITDPGKASKKGRIGLFRTADGELLTLNMTADDKPVDPKYADAVYAMKTVYDCGTVTYRTTFDDVRARANAGLQ